MRRISIETLIGIFVMVVLAGCTKKKVVLDVDQDLCKRFKIDAPSYVLIQDPCDGNLTLEFNLTFVYKGDSSCVNKVLLSPQFYDSTDTEIFGITYTSTIEKPQLTITSKDITFSYDITFNSAEQANQFNYMVMKFHTENDLGDESNDLLIRIQTSCTKVSPNSYDIVNDTAVVVSSSDPTFPIKLWDNAAEDGDIVSVYLNGEWIIDNHSLLNAGSVFPVSTSKLNSGKNDLVVFAINEGSTGPNTVSIAVNDLNKEIDLGSFKSGLKTGNAVEIDFQ